MPEGEDRVMMLLIVGLLLGATSVIVAELILLGVWAHMADRRSDPPTKEEWKVM